MGLPEPRSSGPIEARTLPGRVWPWIVALPVGRAVPRLKRRIRFINQPVMSGGDGAEPVLRQWEYRGAQGRLCLED